MLKDIFPHRLENMPKLLSSREMYLSTGKPVRVSMLLFTDCAPPLRYIS